MGTNFLFRNIAPGKIVIVRAEIPCHKIKMAVSWHSTGRSRVGFPFGENRIIPGLTSSGKRVNDPAVTVNCAKTVVEAAILDALRSLDNYKTGFHVDEGIFRIVPIDVINLNLN